MMVRLTIVRIQVAAAGPRPGPYQSGSGIVLVLVAWLRVGNSDWHSGTVLGSGSFKIKETDFVASTHIPIVNF